MPMDLNDYQDMAMEFDTFPRGVIPQVCFSSITLAEEAGEYCGKVKRMYREHRGNPTPEAIDQAAKELGDVLWSVAKSAGDIGFSLEDIARINLRKLSKRAAEGKLFGTGDDR